MKRKVECYSYMGVCEEDFIWYLNFRGYHQNTIKGLLWAFRKLAQGYDEEDVKGRGRVKIRVVKRHVKAYLEHYQNVIPRVRVEP